MSNEITINITASGEDALKIFKALSTLSGVEVTTSTNIPPMEAELSLEPLPKKVKNLGGRPMKSGRFKSKENLHAFFYNHCAAGEGAFYTTHEVARNAEVSWGIADYWAKKTNNFFKKTGQSARELNSSDSRQ
jgi:hypothetical protein